MLFRSVKDNVAVQDINIKQLVARLVEIGAVLDISEEEE